MPSPEEISHTAVHYLDAVVEEILRCAGTVPILERQCTQDTTLLGHHIPKGTTVLMPTRGHTFTEPGFIVSEKLRSSSSQAAAREHGIRRWETEGMDAFSPERWLVKDAKTGDMTYDSTAGPTIPFGLGIRGCFGRKLAYIELRIFITLIVWNFDLLKCSQDLSGYDAVDQLTHKPRDCFVRLSSRNRA
jgi:cytochrome P450